MSAPRDGNGTSTGSSICVACVVLHNIGIQRGDVFANGDGNLPHVDDDGVRFVGRNDGVLMRQHIVNNFF